MKRLAVTILAAAGLLIVPTSALAANASDGAGRDYGQHHAAMAREGHLGADMNPGHHQGFSGWMMHEE
jgi:hypothetical protein